MSDKSACPVASKCSGCQLANLSYSEQLAFKQKKVDKFTGKFRKAEPIIGMDEPYNYRNKVQAAFGVDRNGRTVSGVYQSKTHAIVPVDSCMLEDGKARDVIKTVRELMKSFKITAYSEYTGRGTVRHVLVKRGYVSGEVMVVIVTSGPIFPKKNDFVRELLRLHPDVTTVVHNVNPDGPALTLGERSNVLYGDGTINEKLGGFTFRISPSSFYQVNPTQTEKLYGEAIKLAGLTGNETVLDAYSGTGTIGIFASPFAKQVIGVELNGDAVHDAIHNAKVNKVKNVRFYRGDAGEFMVNAEKEGVRPDVVIMDPPRAGSDRKFLSVLSKVKPEKIVYVSCNPETLGRDLGYLTSHGYDVRKIVPVDMFPHTAHVESVVLLTKVHK